MLSGRGLCDRLITRPEESYRMWRVVVCDQETSKNEEAKARYRAVENTNIMGCKARKKKQQQQANNFSCVNICNDSGACGQENSPKHIYFWGSTDVGKNNVTKSVIKTVFDNNNKIIYYITWGFLRSCSD